MKFGGRGGGLVAVMCVGKSEDDDNGDESEDWEDEDAAFGSGGSAAENGLAYGVSCEEMVLNHGAAVGDSVEEGLSPVP